jgi:hypothetical protein
VWFGHSFLHVSTRSIHQQFWQHGPSGVFHAVEKRYLYRNYPKNQVKAIKNCRAIATRTFDHCLWPHFPWLQRHDIILIIQTLWLYFFFNIPYVQSGSDCATDFIPIMDAFIILDGSIVIMIVYPTLLNVFYGPRKSVHLPGYWW